jgi:hypothetical protein
MTYTLQDYLLTLHTGQWFGFNGEHTYANLVIHSEDAKPTEQECTDGVASLQAEYDSQEYARNRKAEYDQLNQFEMQFDDDRDGTTTWVDKINEIKARYPK